MDKIKKVYQWFGLKFEADLDDGRKFNASLNVIDVVVGITLFIILVMFCQWLISQAYALFITGG